MKKSGVLFLLMVLILIYIIVGVPAYVFAAITKGFHFILNKLEVYVTQATSVL
jgi:hypothetical protein